MTDYNNHSELISLLSLEGMETCRADNQDSSHCYEEGTVADTGERKEEGVQWGSYCLAGERGIETNH